MSILIMSEVFAYSDTRLATRLVLLALADAAGDSHRMCWESADTIAAKARVSKRQAYASLAVLEGRRIVEHVPEVEQPVEALRYKSVVRRILPVADWLPEDATSAESAPPASADSAPPVSKFSPNPNNQARSNKETVETTSLQGARRAMEDEAEVENTRPGRKGWDAVAAPKRGGRRKSRKQEALDREQAEKELDPAYVVARALADTPSAAPPGGDLPASGGSPAPPVRRTRKPRSKRPSERLAEYFEREALRVGSKVPGAVNKAALGRNLQRWMDEGAEYQTVSRMIEEYWSESWQRSDVTEAWKDFQNRRGALTQRLGKQEQSVKSETDRYDESAW